MATFTDRLRARVAEHGWMVLGVFASAEAPDLTPWHYTVGLTDAGLPELLVSGLGATQGQEVLNAAAARHIRRPIEPGMVDDVASMPLKVLPGPTGEHVQQAWNYVGDPQRRDPQRVRVLQLVWPDAEGRFPGEEGFGYPPEAQQLSWP